MARLGFGLVNITFRFGLDFSTNNTVSRIYIYIKNTKKKPKSTKEKLSLILS